MTVTERMNEIFRPDRSCYEVELVARRHLEEMQAEINLLREKIDCNGVINGLHGRCD
jgi:hypothetical protein